MHLLAGTQSGAPVSGTVIVSLCTSLVLGFSARSRFSGWRSLLFVKVVCSAFSSGYFGKFRRRNFRQVSEYSLTLVVVMALVILSYSKIIIPLGVLTPEMLGLFSLNLSMVLTSIFLLINRRGIFTQIVGILCLENSIVFLSTIIGAKQPVGLEIGMLFDIALWIVVAMVFISMIHTQFGTLSTAPLKKLTEE
jgi:hypothetical protein